MKQVSGIYVAGVIFIVAVVIVTGPLLLIWAINTLFGAGIAYSLKTWAASLILGAVAGSRSISSGK